MLDGLDPDALTDVATARATLGRVLNLVEELSAEVAALKAENQRLRDENSRLKGEHPKPRILSSKRAKQDQSSEQERRETPKTWCKRAKLPALRLERVEVCPLDRSPLPEDAVLKDYQEHTVQDLVLKTETILFRGERYAAASPRPPPPHCPQATAGRSGRPCRRARCTSIMRPTSASRCCTGCSAAWGCRSRGATWGTC